MYSSSQYFWYILINIYQKFILLIARALIGKPRLLVLDEPTEGIQPSIILEIEAAVKRIIEATGISVLLVEQHLHFVRQADRYYAMQKGGIIVIF